MVGNWCTLEQVAIRLINRGHSNVQTGVNIDDRYLIYAKKVQGVVIMQKEYNTSTGGSFWNQIMRYRGADLSHIGLHVIVNKMGKDCALKLFEILGVDYNNE